MSADDIINELLTKELSETIDIFYAYFAHEISRRNEKHPTPRDYKMLLEWRIPIEEVEEDDTETAQLRDILGWTTTVEPELRYYVASADSKKYPSAIFGSPLSQGGTCSGCGSNLISYAKEAICPICGSECYLT